MFPLLDHPVNPRLEPQVLPHVYQFDQAVAHSHVTGIVESGYSYPSGVRAGDHFFRFIGTKASVFERYDKHGTPIIEVHTEQGIDFQEGNGHGQSRPAEIARALAAIEAGNSFAPTIGDALRILEVQDAVYAFARANPNSNGPHPLGPPPP